MIDRVVCKKSYKNFKVNNTYDVMSVSLDRIKVEDEIFDLKKEKRESIFCHICPGKNKCYEPTFDDIFCSVKEARRKKLLKLKPYNFNLFK
jgi:hypothetical protein